MSAKRILITGGAGFIGSALTRRLVSAGHTVRVLDALTPQIHGPDAPDPGWLAALGVEFMRGTVTNRADWQRALAGMDQVVHLAAETGTGQSMYEVEKYCATNSLGTALLLDVLGAQRKKTVQRVILASSRSVYGEGAYRCQRCGDRVNPGVRPAEQLRRHQWDPACPGCGSALLAVPTTENDAIKPASIYAATKYAQEDLVRIACESLGIGYVNYRFQNVYGEGQSLKNPYTGILSIFSTRIRRGLFLPIFEDGLESRDFVHVSDVVEAVTLGVVAAEPANTVFNVGSGTPTTVRDLAERLSRALGREPQVKVTGEFRLGDIRHNYADLTRIRQGLGFAPRMDLTTGLSQFAAWVGTQPLPEDRLEQANRELKDRKLMG